MPETITAADQALRLASQHRRGRNLRQAESICRDLLQTHPQHLGALSLLSELLAEMGDLQGGAELLENAIDETTDQAVRARLFRTLGTLYAENGRLAEGKRAFLQACELTPGDPQHLANLGMICHEQDELDEAAKYLREAIRINPSLVPALGTLATVLVRQGRLADAVDVLEQAMQHASGHPGPYVDLTMMEELGAYKLSPEQIEKMEQLLDGQLAPEELCQLLGALTHIFDRRNDCEKAFEYCVEANRARRLLMRRENRLCDIELRRLLVDATIAAHDQFFFDRVRDGVHDSQRSILIVGMPRTGKTLVEQILCTTDQIAGAGEHLALYEHVKGLVREATVGYPECMADVDAVALRSQAERHLQLLKNFVGSDKRVISTRSGNFMYLGLFRAMFPNGRIIHCRRDPLDTCVTCYLQDFQRLSYGAAQEELAHYYCQYERMMSHWNEVLAPPIHEVTYEDLVTQPEPTIKALCDYCDLPWDDRYLIFYRDSRPVRSEDQRNVHRPLDRRNVGIGKRYEAYVQPMMQILGLAPIPRCGGDG